MTTTIINNTPQYPYGQMTNQAISRIRSLNTAMERLTDAIATASSGYEGVPGTEFEIGNPTVPSNRSIPNLFGVVAGETPGEQGAAYSYAMGQLHTAWLAFWAAAEPYVEQLDNGQMGA